MNKILAIERVRAYCGKIFLIGLIFLALWIGVTMGWSDLAHSQSSERYQEYHVKAAFLYNFAKFVEWPPESSQSSQSLFIIGILGKDPFGGGLDLLKGKAIEGRELVIKRFPRLDELEKCHILFISSSEKNQLPKILKAVEKFKTLTVGDVEGFAQAGGSINFFIEEEKIRFEINLQASQRQGIRISSQLLKLARIIREN